MREIKFRAWKVLEKEWFKPVYEAYDGKLYDVSITMNGCVMERTLQSNASMLNSDNYILQQFTGLKDKRGIDIYEGDILKRITSFDDGTYDVHLGIITWDDCSFYSHSIKQEISRSLGGKSNNTTYEVIGNIYENQNYYDNKPNHTPHPNPKIRA